MENNEHDGKNKNNKIIIIIKILIIKEEMYEVCLVVKYIYIYIYYYINNDGELLCIQGYVWWNKKELKVRE